MPVNYHYTPGVHYREGDGLWWPNYDHSPTKCLNKVILQIGAIELMLAHCRGNRVCVQAGGHVGLWPKRLALTFGKVITFEPDPSLFDAMEKNLDGISNIDAHKQALGREIAGVLMNPHPSSGSWAIRPPPAGRVPVQQVTIDSLNLEACDAIVLDVEGYEPEALAGAVATIRKFRPVLHLEVFTVNRELIHSITADLGYTFRKRVHSDEVFVPA